ncbi:hypothetical protein QQ054_33390 [Oscillatoria amoena NRMC-F 0135]|nr:hypothetical protein [Oscillatoria amoena NRMC-F 0135]
MTALTNPSPIFSIALFLLMLCSFATCTHAQDRPVLLPEEIKHLLPEKIEGFTPDGKATTRLVKIGTLSYSLVERSFRKSKSRIKILLFDYNNALIMYNQATGKWKSLPTIESDSLVSRYVELPDYIGRETSNKVNGTSQILLGVNNRFYLTLAGQQVGLEMLRSIIELVDLARFPRTAIDNPKSR